MVRSTQSDFFRAGQKPSKPPGCRSKRSRCQTLPPASMTEAKVGWILVGVGVTLFFFGWALDRSELRGRSLGNRRALVSSIATWGGIVMALVGLILNDAPV